ncbi:MAG: hypothetical protein M9895_04290, partial [Aquamicrobium sp.]|uniref:hypothetical protein n=1 Tax=Aquamicrobium sp. TaxID=1872579 RepID=UPI00349E864A|nr:hypothetical protein [Aquamicrobium sp.]
RFGPISADAGQFAAELSEEMILREMEDATGNYISRRGDADPALLLAPTSELLSCIDSEAQPPRV